MAEHDWNARRRALWEQRLRVEAKRDEAHARRTALRARLMDGTSVFALFEPLLRMLRLFSRGQQNATQPLLEQLTFSFDALPGAFDRFRVLHLSDMHFRAGDDGFAEVIAQLISGIHVDLCVMTGDFRFEHHGPFDHVARALDVLLPAIHSRRGVIAILGNHDRSAFVPVFRDKGIAVLINDRVRIAPGDLTSPETLSQEAPKTPETESNHDPIWIAGVDDPHHFRCDDLEAATEGIPPVDFTILLAHSPELALASPKYHIDLYLCGHTHWGQVRLPWIGPVFLNARCPRRFCAGRWESGGTQGYTTAGLGTTDVPVRFNCPPSAAVITLRRRGPLS